MRLTFRRVATGRLYQVAPRDVGRYHRSPNFVEVHVCETCGFEAKSAAGLGSHERTHDGGE